MKLFLVRHGETEHNKLKILMGWHNSELTYLGIDQANAVARKLMNYKIDLIVSSDLGRAAETAKVIAAQVKSDCLYSWLLRERYNGKLETGTTDVNWEIINKNGEFAKENEVESVDAMTQRAKAFIAELKLLPKPVKNLVIVSHAGFINSLLYVTVPGSKFREIANTEVIEVEI